MNEYKPNELASSISSWMLVVALVVVGGSVSGYLTTRYMNRQTEAVRQSNQYRTSAEDSLTGKMTDWQRLDTKAQQYGQDAANKGIVDSLRAQQNTLLNQMQQEAQRLQPDQVPQAVKSFLDAHPAPTQQQARKGKER